MQLQELCEIYQGSSLALPQATPEDLTAGKRKPIDGECPICFMDFEPDKEEIVWCRAACGNNIHKECFDKWASVRRAIGVRCVYWLVAHNPVQSSPVQSTTDNLVALNGNPTTTPTTLTSSNSGNPDASMMKVTSM